MIGPRHKFVIPIVDESDIVKLLPTWGHVMREYHFYFLDQYSQIQTTKIAHFADDLAALEFAQQLRAPADIEIWTGTRLVTRLNAKGDSVPKERGAA